MEKYVLLNPFIKGNIEIGIIILSGIISIIFDAWKIPFFPVINIIGGILLILSFIFHAYCEKYHKQAHVDTGEITTIVTTGIYSKLRHPIYLSLIVMNISTALVFNSWLSLLFGMVFSITWIFTALEEETYLLKKFNREYEEYMEKVHWRILPGIF
jgi:protein-S-isoprenylcysteine O-methyltransferase Ste14